MEIKVFGADQYRNTEWSGGSSTQLYIYPETAGYPGNDFLFRISTAHIKGRHSVFTHLPGIDRKLVLLEGALLIEHDGHHCKLLLPFEIDQFDGAWKTESKGTGKDFNVMTQGNLQSDLNVFIIKPHHIVQFFSSPYNFLHIYLFKGSIILNMNQQQIILEEGMSVLIENMEDYLKIESNNKSILIVTKISL